MKQLFSFLIAYFFTQTIFAQSPAYVPFPLNSGSWLSYNETKRADTLIRNVNHYYFQGEFETHNNLSYAVLYKESQTYLKRQDYTIIDSIYVPPAKYAWMREDNKNVYAFWASDTVEQLLYNFNLAVGDTVPLAGIPFLGSVVTQIDSILINNTYRKRYFLYKLEQSFPGPSYDLRIVEGIGTIANELFEPYSPNYLNHLGAYFKNRLVSFCDGGQSIYGIPSCDIHLATAMEEPHYANEMIYPNPITDKGRLYLESMKGKNPHILIFDNIGKLQQRIDLQSNTVEIDANDLGVGMYFVRYQSDSESRMIGKISVQH